MENLTSLVQTSKFQYITLTQDRFVAPALKFFGEYCQEEIDLLSHFVKSDSIILDIGANIGTHTLGLAQKNPQGEVWSFEPQKFVYQMLTGNVALNNLTHVRTFHCAVGKESGQIGVPLINYAIPDNYGGLDLKKYAGLSEENYDMTPLITLDSLSLPEVALMKIDVDGMEEDVLRGAFKTIFQCAPVIYIEADRDPQRAGLIGFLNTLGYRTWEHRPTVVQSQSPQVLEMAEDVDSETRKNVQNFKNYQAINLICLPKDQPSLDESLIQKFNLKPILM